MLLLIPSSLVEKIDTNSSLSDKVLSLLGYFVLFLLLHFLHWVVEIIIFFNSNSEYLDLFIVCVKML